MKKMFLLRLGISGVFGVIFANAGFSQTTHYQLDACSGRNGVAVYYYTNLPELARMDISDVCLTSSGELMSIEPMVNLTNVGKQDWSDQLENLETGTSSTDRRRIKFRDFSQTAPQGYAQNTGTLEISHGPETPNNWGASEYWAKGYAYDVAFTNSGQAGVFSTFAELFVFDHTGIQHGITAAIFSGEVGFENGHATAAFGDYGGTTLNPNVTVDLVLSQDGSITGTGNIYFENARLTGLGPTEFVSAQLTIDRFVGHVAGPDGRELRVLGIASGTYKGQDGRVYDLNASIEFSGFILQ